MDLGESRIRSNVMGGVGEVFFLFLMSRLNMLSILHLQHSVHGLFAILHALSLSAELLRSVSYSSSILVPLLQGPDPIA